MQGNFIEDCRDGRLDKVQKIVYHSTREDVAEMLKAINFYAFRWAAEHGRTKTLKYLWSICPDDLKNEMLKAEGFYAFSQAAYNGHTETVMCLWSICPDDLKPEMLKAYHFSAFCLAAEHGHTETLKYLWSICPDDLKIEMLKAINFSSFLFSPFHFAAANGHTETLKYLWSICPDDLKNKMLKANHFSAFRKAAENGHFHTLEYLLSICDEKLREEALFKLRDEDKNIAVQRLDQRNEITKNSPQFDIDMFNSLLKTVTRSENFAKVLLTCKKPEVSTALPTDIFYEVASYVIGKNIHKPLIQDALEAATIALGDGFAMNSHKFFLHARKLRFSINEELDQYTHNAQGIGCAIS